MAKNKAEKYVVFFPMIAIRFDDAAVAEEKGSSPQQTPRKQR